MYIHPKDMEDPDYEATATILNDHSPLQQHMCLHPKDMEDFDHEATPTLPTDNFFVQHCMHCICFYSNKKKDLGYEATATSPNNYIVLQPLQVFSSANIHRKRLDVLYQQPTGTFSNCCCSNM
jgi:hypothetical protein